MASLKNVEVASSEKKSKKYGSFPVQSYTYSVVEDFDGTSAADKFADALSLLQAENPDSDAMAKVVSLVKTALNAERKRVAFSAAGGERLKLVRNVHKAISSGMFALAGITEATPENVQKVIGLIEAQKA